MKITFSIEYHTHWGEELFLMLGNDRYSALKMYYTPGDIWTVTLDVSDETSQLRYRYMVKEGGEVTRVEQCSCHTLFLDAGIAHYRVEDCWDDIGDWDASDDFIARLMGESDGTETVHYQPASIVVEAMMPLHLQAMKPAIAGEATALGAWNVRRSVAMQSCGDSLWRIDLNIPADQLPTQFKLIAVGKKDDVLWESGDNRWLRQSPHSNEVAMVRGLCFRYDGELKPMVATFVELETLRSDRDMGIGDLGDLKKVIQWVAATGQNAVVVNSITDTAVVDGWMPVEVRKRVMANAINPAYISTEALGSFNDKRLLAKYQQIGMTLNRLDAAQLDEVRILKTDYAQAVFAEKGTAVTRSASYRKFVRENASWLHPYAAQSILQGLNDSRDWTSWGNYSRYAPEQIERFLKARHREATFVYFMQYQLRQQLLTMARYARGKKVSLLCDMAAPRHVKNIDPKEPWVNQRFIEQRLRDAGSFALIPLRDWLLIDGVFLPRVVKSPQRLAVSLEELIAAHDFNNRVKSIMAPEKRTP